MIYMPCIKLSPVNTISIYCTGSLPQIQRSVVSKYSRKRDASLNEPAICRMCSDMAWRYSMPTCYMHFGLTASCTEPNHHRSRKQAYQAYNDCAQPWLQDAFRGIFNRRGMCLKLGRKQCLNVGSHMWWGDLYTQQETLRSSSAEACSFIKSISQSAIYGASVTNFYAFFFFAKNSKIDQLDVSLIIHL